MHRVQKSVLIAYSAQQMFTLVDDVAHYPEFLPWCGGSEVLETHPGGQTARLDINYHGVRAHFTTENVNVPAESITVTLRDGPFRHLHGEWTFRALTPAACKIELALAWEFKTHVLESIVGPIFNHIANTFIDAFVRRAEVVYAKPP